MFQWLELFTRLKRVESLMNEKRISVSNAEGPLFLYKMRIRGFSLGCPFCVLECTIRFSLFLEVARFGFHFLYKKRRRGLSSSCPFCVQECTIRFSLFLEVARFGFRECTIKVSLLYSSPSSSSSYSRIQGFAFHLLLLLNLLKVLVFIFCHLREQCSKFFSHLGFLIGNFLRRRL